MDHTMVFARVEKKYVLDEEMYHLLMNEIKDHIQLDQYGKHTICNLYFDNDHDELARSNFQKPIYKEKLRLRSYGVPQINSLVFLEMKKKYKGIVYKRRISLTLDEVEMFIQGKCPIKDQIEKEIQYFIQFYHPYPKIYLAYERCAYYGIDEPELRMTFDENIRSRQKDLFLEYGDDGQLLFNEQRYLLEIKTVDAYPTWLIQALNKLGIYPASFSKYNNVYKSLFLKEAYVCV
ncbi:polyphosphate polymerase domain-containing protein [Beduini massiliensis]|uniref:polyphosphate polymerase domain-containing protein n=1 Tax=Beduini massiliensis TaxID=1585974 RepID=UPI00059A9781|nr:polyphosphate polymerase domain-containing protein [Beduini massiliensis]